MLPLNSLTSSPLAACLSGLEVDVTALTGTANLCCPADFPGFAGHFPNEPILPAVMQLLAVRLLVEAVAQTPLVVVAVERLKFKGMVRPGEEVVVQVKLLVGAGRIKADFSLRRMGAAVASGTVFFRIGEGA